MRKLIFLFALILFVLTGKSKTISVIGDTIKVQAFTFGSNQDAIFNFPSDTIRFEKILMNYKLKCNPAQTPACGEWDYLTYTYLYDHTGQIDSTMNLAPSYKIEGSSPDTVYFMRNPSWKYIPRIEQLSVRTDTLSFDSAEVGNGLIVADMPLGNGHSSRSQYLWKASELSSQISSGNITGIRFFLASTGDDIQPLIIRIKNSAKDSLASTDYEDSGFITVYSQNTAFTNGWNTLKFSSSFSWDGTSNLIVDVSSNTLLPVLSNAVSSEKTSWSSSLTSSVKDYSLFFEGVDYIDVPPNALSSIDSFITISFWQYGNPLYQPQDQSIFEGVDSAGNRVLNVHLPWSDGNVYWDAGNNGGSYDRINKVATANMYEAQWNHWAFTKNVKTKKLYIYLNGVIFHSGSAKTNRMLGIKKFKIGSAANGSISYDGKIDEFTIWNKALDVNEIKNWMYKSIDNTHPSKSNLLLYYKFDDVNNMLKVADSSGNNNTGILGGPPERIPYKGSEVFKNFKCDSIRPNIVLEQGVYISHTDTIVRIDSVMKPPMQIVFYKDLLNPTTPTDTLLAWPPYFNNYVYSQKGKAIDSVQVAIDSTIYLVNTPYYVKFDVVNRYEIGRLITPYGNGLSLGNGFTWVYDVSDYRTLLHDSVHLAAGNWQELLDISFYMIKGIPPRDPIKIENLWVGQPAYGTATSIENFLSAKTVQIDNTAENTRLKVRSTGHGFGGTDNCAEFCPRYHSFKVNGTQRFNQLMWRDNCGLNPIYPQGGTWVYNRANWCPGAEVTTHDFELTSFVTKGASATLDYDLEPYNWNGAGSTPYYAIETQLVSYSAPNFSLDAAIEDIKAPSKKDMFKRMNPICGKPMITIKNTGTTPLTSLVISYGLVGGIESQYTWTGNLNFLQQADVELPAFSAITTESIKRFYALVSAPNGSSDQYANNNRMETIYASPANYKGKLIFQLKTNNFGSETSYEIKDVSGAVVFSRSSLSNNKIYNDTLNLAEGCYEFRLKDAGNDGLSWWANTDQGSGYMKIINAIDGKALRGYNSDFGAEIFEQFTFTPEAVLSMISKEEGEMEIYPNPASNFLSIDIHLGKGKEGILKLKNVLGEEVMVQKIINPGQEHFQLDLTNQKAGIYFIELQVSGKKVLKKFVLTP